MENGKAFLFQLTSFWRRKNKREILQSQPEVQLLKINQKKQNMINCAKSMGDLKHWKK